MVSASASISGFFIKKTQLQRKYVAALIYFYSYVFPEKKCSLRNR